MGESFDLLIRGGTIVDGSGAPGRAGDVGIRRGRVAALGDVKGSAARTLDASGCVVAPGFVDIHTHYDAQVFWDRMLNDAVIFDPDTVGCGPLRRVRDFPAGADRLVSDATGIRAVVVEGTPIREDGCDVVDPDGPLPGHVLRGGKA